MKNLLSVGAALMLTTTAATAGGLDRSGQPVGALFADGRYVELSFGKVTPDVSGSFSVATPLGELTYDSGNVANDYTQLSFAYKTDINDKLSVALIFDQPFGANVDYSEGSVSPEELAATLGALDPSVAQDYPIEGSNAEFRSKGITALARYKLNDNFSVHGGLRYVTIDADATIVLPGVGTYAATYAEASDTQVLIGGAYERKDIAMRVALTYATEMEFSHETEVGGTPVGTTDYIMPASLNLDFQTGIAADTLLMASARWVEWSKTSIDSPGYPANPIVSFDDDKISYAIGIGRRINDNFSASIMVGYEAASGGTSSNLAPTDGNTSVTIGGRYTVGNGLTVSGGYRMVWLGDTETELGGQSPSFADNTASGFGLTIGYTY